MLSEEIYIINIRFNRVVRKWGFFSGDDEICSNSILLVHAKDKERDIHK